MTDHASATRAEIGEMLGLKDTQVKTILRQLIKDDIVVAEGANRNRVYKLKA